MDKTIFELHLRSRLDIETILDEVVSAFEVSRDEVRTLEEATANTPVVVEVHWRSVGLCTSVSIYVDTTKCMRIKSSLELAALFASSLKQDVVVSPPSDEVDPYVWTVVEPNGQARRVKQVFGADEGDGFVVE